MTVFDVAVVEAVAGQGDAGGGDAAVLQQVETWGGGDGGGGARAGGRVPLGERLHGGEDQSQAVSHILIGSTGQSWGVAWITGKPVQSKSLPPGNVALHHPKNLKRTHLPHPQPAPWLLGSAVPAPPSPVRCALPDAGA